MNRVGSWLSNWHVSGAKLFFISFLCPLSKNEEGEMAHKLEKIFAKLERLETKLVASI
jgi:hypothetical protein